MARRWPRIEGKDMLDLNAMHQDRDALDGKRR
jgi:hypothetical protein